MNKVILIGNLGRDPEVRTTPSGQTVATLSIATSEKWTDKDGARQERTDWHTVEAWGRLAEICGQYLAKGAKVMIEGKLKHETWEDKVTGEKRYRTKVVAAELEMLGGGQRQGEADRDHDGGGFQSRRQAPAQQQRRPVNGQRPIGAADPAAPPAGSSFHSQDYGPGDFPADPSDDDIPF